MTAPHLLIAGPSGQVQNYLSAFSALGSICRALPDALPKRLPIDPSEPLSAFLPDPAASFDALILPGGGDIDPILFHQENQGARAMDPELDRLQLFLLRSFLRKNLPVLGICKGMQLINVCLGGGIIQDLPTAGRHAYIGKDQIHPTYTEKGSLLHTLYGENFPVNSAHHQGIAEPGEGLIVIQHAPDGVAEAIVHTSLPILGIQWHPERMCFAHKRPDTPDGSLLLARFLSLIRS